MLELQCWLDLNESLGDALLYLIVQHDDKNGRSQHSISSLFLFANRPCSIVEATPHSLNKFQSCLVLKETCYHTKYNFTVQQNLTELCFFYIFQNSRFTRVVFQTVNFLLLQLILIHKSYLSIYQGMTNLITTSYPCGTNLPILFKLGKIYKLKVNLIFFKKVGKKKISPSQTFMG